MLSHSVLLFNTVAIMLKSEFNFPCCFSSERKQIEHYHFPVANNKYMIEGAVPWWSSGQDSALSLPGPRFNPWLEN